MLVRYNLKTESVVGEQSMVDAWERRDITRDRDVCRKEVLFCCAGWRGHESKKFPQLGKPEYHSGSRTSWSEGSLTSKGR